MAIEDIAAQNLNPYLQWLLSRTAQAQGTAPASQPLAALQTAAAPPNPVMIQALGQLGSAYGGDLGLAMRTAQRAVPGSFAGADVFGRTAAPDIASLMQQPATISSRDAMSALRNALAIGNYQYPDMSKDSINAIAKAWNDLNAGWSMTGDAFKATYDTVSGDYATNVDGVMVPLDPNNPVSNRMAGLFNLVLGGQDADAILNQNEIKQLGLTDQEKIDLKQFDAEEKTRREAMAKIAADQQAFASTYGLPSPGEQWNIPPEVAGLIYQRQSTGLTDVEAAQQAADVAQARYLGAQTSYVPKTADQLRKEAIARVAAEAESRDSRYADTTGRVVRGINPATERKARLLAGKAAEEVIGSPDRMESAASRAYSSVMRPAPERTVQQQEEIDRMVQEGIWTEGYKAMRGVKTGGGDEYAESQRAKKAAREAVMRQEALANEIANDLIANYGTPFEAAIIQARGIVNANSKNYARPSGPTTNYPMGAISTQTNKSKPKIQRMGL